MTNKMDCICTVYWIDHELFEKNLQSWIKELPLSKIYLGVNNHKEMHYCKKIAKDYPLIKIVDQLHLITLGGCLGDLIKRVETDWFTFVHADVFITPKAFCIMKEYMKKNVGIIESHREHWGGDYSRVIEKNKYEYLPINKASDYYYRNRAFSGFQIMRKKAIMSLVERLEDDYLYRNEDMIFHYECVKNGYEYVKTWAIHIHQNINKIWTRDHQETHDMQYRGFVKYTEPNELTITPCIAALKQLKKLHKYSIYEPLEFCYKHNANWASEIAKWWDRDLNMVEGKKK